MGERRWRRMHEEERVEGVVNAARELTDAVNGLRGTEVAKIFFEEFIRQHRTLQQSFFRAFLLFMKLYGMQGNFDDRNEASVKLCHMISKMDEDHQLTYLPLI
jgi:hypothetical protein